MNYDYRERRHVDRTPVTRLTPAEVQAVRVQLQADYHAQMARLQALKRIVADAEARRAWRAIPLPFDPVMELAA